MILKYIEEANNVRVLAHLKNLDFSSLQFDILHRHLLFGHNFNCDGLARLLVDRGLNQAKLALSEGLLDLVEVEHI